MWPSKKITNSTLATSASVTSASADTDAVASSLKLATSISTTTITTPTTHNIMNYHNVIAMLTLLLCGLATVDGLKCYMCGQYNEGVGSITPCLNYSDQFAHNYLNECSKKSEKFCVKYVSELSTVRDCATECVEKEIWETQTYCCNEDGCNGSNRIGAFSVMILFPIAFFVLSAFIQTFKVRR